MPQAASQTTDVQRYAHLLAEAEAIRGVSLGQDAWRRLKRNRVAMFSLGFLTLLSLLAFFTPLLPLQPPILVDTTRTFAPPQAWPLFVETLQMQPATGRAIDPLEQGFGKLNRMNRGLLDLRLKLFGSWQLNSIC